jgi:hydroxymethylbilane synthase
MPTNKPIRIGTRNSALAVWQARHIADLLVRTGYQIEIIEIETIGDQENEALQSLLGLINDKFGEGE